MYQNIPALYLDNKTGYDIIKSFVVDIFFYLHMERSSSIRHFQLILLLKSFYVRVVELFLQLRKKGTFINI